MKRRQKQAAHVAALLVVCLASNLLPWRGKSVGAASRSDMPRHSRKHAAHAHVVRKTAHVCLRRDTRARRGQKSRAKYGSSSCLPVRHLFPSNLPPHPVGDLFGVGAFVTQRSSTVSRLVLGRVRLLGARWVREEFTATRLHDASHAPYDWSTYDRVVNQERAAGLSVLGLLDYSNTWGYGDHGEMPHADMGRLSGDFAAYAYAVARHFRGRVHDWQIWNEPNLPVFWRPRPNAGDYARLLRASYRAVKRADAANTVVTAGTSGIDLSFVRRVASDGGRFDVLSVHPYRQAPETELINEIRQLRSLHRPIWFSEIGWPAGDGCFDVCTDENAQAAYLVRFYALAAAAGVGRVFWYDLRDDAHSPESPEAHFGLLRRDLSAKPAFLAYAAMARLLRGARFMHADALNRDGLYALRFRGAYGPTEIVWNTGTRMQTVTLRWPVRTATLLHLTGEPVSTLGRASGPLSLAVPAGGEPLFLAGRRPKLGLPPLGPLLHFAPPPPPTPVPGTHHSHAPGGAWAVRPVPTPKPTVQPRSHEHRVTGSKTRPKRKPRPTPTATPTPTPTVTATPVL